MSLKSYELVHLKSLLFTQELIEGYDKTRVSKNWLMDKPSEIEEKSYPSEFIYTVKFYIEEWKHLTEKIKEIEKHLKIQAESDKAIHQIYQSVPGIGPIHGRQLANELGDMSQFRNEKQLFSYTGLTPSEYSSGEHVRQGHISRQGRSVFRKILVEAAWVAITKDPCLRKIYDRISRKSGGKRAIIGVARRLVGRMRFCLLSGKLYEINIIEKKKKNA